MMDSVSNAKHALILFVVCFFAFFVNNHIIPADLMESRNLATAQEMVTQGNYLVPTLNGELRLEKPPLPTWIAATIDHIAPDNLSAQRCAAGVSATLLVFFLYLLVIELTKEKRLALIASLVLASCYNVVMMGRTATWDIYCHSFMVMALFFLIQALNREGAQWLRFLVSGICMGLSFLSKGPVSFYALLLPFLISYFIIYRPSLKGKTFSVLLMVLVCLAISLWWPAYIYLFQKDWGMHVANKESSSWTNHNVRPWYYYWAFAAESGIWALFWITSLVWPYWKLRFKETQIRKAYLFSVLWTLSALVLLSLIPEKKTRYLLPLLIPGALNIAFFLYYFVITHFIPRKEKILYRINISIVLGILCALPVGLYFLFYKEGNVSLWLYVLISAIGLFLAGALYYYTFRSSSKPMYPLFCIVAVMILVEGLCFIPVSKFFINDERCSIRGVRTVKEVQHLPFYYVEGEDMRIELVYESNRIIRPLNVKDQKMILSKLPFVLVSGLAPDSVLHGLSVQTKLVGVYDNNWEKRTNKRYNKSLVRYVSVVQRK